MGFLTSAIALFHTNALPVTAEEIFRRRVSGMPVVALGSLAMLLCGGAATAADGKLLGTGGLVSLDGAAGGGITPWAVVATYAEREQIGAVASIASVNTRDFRLASKAIALGFNNRFEVSLAQQRFYSPAAVLGQDVIGAKAVLAGDLIYGTTPQLSLGVQFKRSTYPDRLKAIGINDTQDVDFYLSTSRLFLNGPLHRSWLINATARSTKAQQTGLLGFSNRRSLMLELSAAVLLNNTLALGFEFKDKPDQLAGLREDPWQDVFLAWFPNKQLTWGLAYVDLGRVAGRARQRGTFLTFQGQF
jgi:hypothetical protein